MIKVESDGKNLILIPETGDPIVMPIKEAALLISQALVKLDVVKASPFMAGYTTGYQDGADNAWKQAAREWDARERKQHRLAQLMRLN